VRRWKSGQGEPRPGVWADLSALMDERASNLENLVDEIAKRIL
jgi:hypothetical protein